MLNQRKLRNHIRYVKPNTHRQAVHQRSRNFLKSADFNNLAGYNCSAIFRILFTTPKNTISNEHNPLLHHRDYEARHPAIELKTATNNK